MTYALPQIPSCYAVLQLITANKVDYLGMSSDLDDIVEDLSVPKRLFKEFLATGAVRNPLRKSLRLSSDDPLLFDSHRETMSS